MPTLLSPSETAPLSRTEANPGVEYEIRFVNLIKASVNYTTFVMPQRERGERNYRRIFTELLLGHRILFIQEKGISLPPSPTNLVTGSQREQERNTANCPAISGSSSNYLVPTTTTTTHWFCTPYLPAMKLLCKKHSSPYMVGTHPFFAIYPN